MIQGKIRNELTIETVLEKTTEIEIFNRFMPWKWELNQVCISPFPGKNGYEKTPSFIIGNKYGTINYKAFNDDDKHGDCFSFVKQLYNLPNLDAVLRLIDTQLNLGISDGREVINKPIIQSSYKQEINKRTNLLQIITRRFTEEEKKWWLNFYQIEKDLQENNIYSIKKAYLNKQLLPIKDDELRFGYFYPEYGWKLYFPDRDKRRKWLSNVPLSLSYGLKNLNKDKNTIVTKSLKDFLVIRKIYANVCHVQNESLSSFSKDTIEYLNNNSKQVFCNFDSDLSGKKASLEVTNKYGWKHINVPDNLYPIKDIAEWAKLTNLQTIEDYFKTKYIFD